MPTPTKLALLLLLLAGSLHAQDITEGQQKLGSNPWTDATDIDRSAFGVSAGADGPPLPGEPPAGAEVSRYYPTARNLRVENFWGTGIWTHAGNGRIIDCISGNNYVGARLGSSDSESRGNFFFNVRDVGLWITANAGNCQSNQDHCYGARIACYNEGGMGFRANLDTFADALIGHLSNSEEIVTNCLFQHNSVCDLVFKGGNSQAIGCIFYVQRETKELNTFSIPGLPSYNNKCCARLEGDGGAILGGSVVFTTYVHSATTPSGNAATGVIVTANDCEVKTNLVDGDGIDGTTAIYVGGSPTGLVVDSKVIGFSQAKERLLVCDGKPQGLDITFRIAGVRQKDGSTVSGVTKPIGGYIKIGAGWTGSIRIIDTTNGKVISLPKGKGA